MCIILKFQGISETLVWRDSETAKQPFRYALKTTILINYELLPR